MFDSHGILRYRMFIKHWQNLYFFYESWRIAILVWQKQDKEVFICSFQQNPQRMNILGPTNTIVNESQQVASWFLEPCHTSLSKIWKHSYILTIKLPQKHTYDSMYFNVLYQLFPFHWKKKWLLLITTMTSEYSVKDHWVKLSWFSSQYKSFFFRCVAPGAIPPNKM